MTETGERQIREFYFRADIAQGYVTFAACSFSAKLGNLRPLYRQPPS